MNTKGKYYLTQNIASVAPLYWCQGWTLDPFEAALFDTEDAAEVVASYAEGYTEAQVIVQQAKLDLVLKPSEATAMLYAEAESSPGTVPLNSALNAVQRERERINRLMKRWCQMSLETAEYLERIRNAQNQSK